MLFVKLTDDMSYFSTFSKYVGISFCKKITPNPENTIGKKIAQKWIEVSIAIHGVGTT